MVKEQEYLSINDLDVMLPVCKKTIRRMIKRGDLPATKFGKTVIVKRTDLEKYFYLRRLPGEKKSKRRNKNVKRTDK